MIERFFSAILTKEKHPKQIVCTQLEKSFCLAQINVAEPVEPLTSDTLQGFVSRLEEINALAERSDGFVWRLMSDDGDATSIQNDQQPELIINMSQWRDLPALRTYVFQTVHLQLLKQRAQWFVPRPEKTAAMWWMPRDQQPTVDEAFERLEVLNQQGSTPEAFTFADPWPAPFSLSRAAIGASTQTDPQNPSLEIPNLQTATPDDCSAVEQLLDACGLPSPDLPDLWNRGGWAYFLKATSESGETIGAGGLEICRDDALLRSLAVREDCRDSQIGHRLVDTLETLARERDIERCYLLTETAPQYFLRRGYVEVDRASVPRAVADSAQFATLCPDSAKCLVKRLNGV